MWSRIKGYAVAAGLALAAGFWFVIHFMNAGRQQERADSIVKGQKENDAFDKRIQAGHAAGNRPDDQRVLIDQDPFNRANRRD